MLNSKSKATASISANMPAHVLSCESCAVGFYCDARKCDEFQKKGRCRAVALVSLMNSGKVRIAVSGDDAKLIEVK